jgi:DNA-binding CsgD family transcriptional regulator
MGDLAEAERHLDVAVPSAAFGTLGGVAYLDARGQFHLSRGHHDTALQDFLTAGHLMKLWKTDCPSAVPWRTHAVQALLHKGQATQAKEMIAEQMSLLPDGHRRTRGLAGRSLAATLRLDQRPPVLLEAASILDRCGDSLNLARTLADLGHTYTSLGELAQGRSYAHQAKELADRCDAVLLSALPVTADEETDEEGQNDARRLSSAEGRVAELAALGNTNEQIARKLYITVSTVEQHLTRIYRKLGIRRRTQLASFL